MSTAFETQLQATSSGLAPPVPVNQTMRDRRGAQQVTVRLCRRPWKNNTPSCSYRSRIQ